MTAAIDSPAPRVGPDSYLTLHYRISLADSGVDVVSTFGQRPATLQLGIGQLAEPLNDACRGSARAADGSASSWAADDAFGQRNAELVQRLACRSSTSASRRAPTRGHRAT